MITGSIEHGAIRRKAQNSVECGAGHGKKTLDSRGKDLLVGEQKPKESSETMRDENGERSQDTKEEVKEVSGEDSHRATM